MGKAARRASVRKFKPINLSIIIIFSLMIPANASSIGEAEYYQKWVQTLNKGNTKEKIYALYNTPASLDCCSYKKDPNIFDPIFNALRDKDPGTRLTAVVSLKHVGRSSTKCCGETKIVPSLIEALKDKDSRVREEAAKALGRYYKDERAIDALIPGLRDKDPWVRLNVAFALGEIGAVKAVNPLLNLLEDDSDWRNKFVQQECVIAIKKIESGEATHKKGSIMAQAGTLQGARAAQQAREKALETGAGIVGLDDQTAPRVISAIIRKFDDPYLKSEIIGAISDFKILGARKLLIEATQDPNDRIRELAVQALLDLSLALREWIDSTPPSPRMDDPNVEVFIKLLADSAVKVRGQSVVALGRLMETRAIEPLIEASRDRSEELREKVIVALSNFADERILDVAINFIMRDPQSNLGDSACATFMSVAKKTAKERVFVYRKNGIRYVSKNMSDIPWGIKASERLVHPAAVGKLFGLIGVSNEKAKLSALNLFPRFQDERIEGVIFKYLDDPSPQLRKQVISIIPYFSGNTVVPRLITASRDKHNEIREKAVRALGEFQDKRALEPLIERLRDLDPEVRTAALNSLKTYDDPRLSGLVIKLLRDDSLSVRKAAILNIKERRDRQAVEALALLLEDVDNEVVNFTVEALEAIGDQRATDPLIKALKGEFNRNRAYGGDVTLRMNAAKALGSIKDRRAVPALIECLPEDNPFLRRRVVSVLKKIGDPAGLEAIKNIPKDELPPEIGSSTPIRPADVKLPPPSASIPKGYSPGSGLDPLLFERSRKIEEKQPPPKVIALLPLYQTKTLMKIRKESKTSLDIKPLIAKLQSTDSWIRREAAESLGEIGNQEVTDQLIPLLKDRDEYVRQAAARALGKLKDRKAVEDLLVGLKDPDVNVRAFSIWALGEIQDSKAIEPLSSLLLDNEEKIRDHSFEALRKFRDPISRRIMVNTLVKGAEIESSAWVTLSRLISLEGKEVVLKAVEDHGGDNAKTLRNYIDLMEANIQNVSDIASKALEDYPDRGMVISELSNYIDSQTGVPTKSISLLGRFKDRRVLPILLPTLKKRKDSYYRLTVINAIGDLGDKEAIEPLLQILGDDKEYPGPRMAAARGLGKLNDIRATEPLRQILENKKEDKQVRISAAGALGSLKDKKAVEPLINILMEKGEDIWLRVAAASALGDIGDEKALKPLESAMKDSPDNLRHGIEIALRKFQKERR